MCDALNVSRSGFYAWESREESPRKREDREILEGIKEIHEESRDTYGSPRVHAELQRRGRSHGRKRIARLMRQNGIFGKARSRRRVRTTDSNHTDPIAPNLVDRRFGAEAANQLWVADITYIPTGEGWLYLASIIDVFSRKVVGWAMDETMKTELALSALRMALGERKPEAGLVHHSDRGSQYASKEYRDTLQASGIICSMSRKGDCYDNALKESFFHTLKTELIRDSGFKTRASAKTAIFDYIEAFYNRIRLHSALDYRSPAEFETDAAA